jgi:PTS system mannose-specific IIA component
MILIGIVLVTHGALAQSFLDVVELISGPQKSFRALEISATDNIEEKRNNLLEVIDAVDQGKGVIVLTDLFGGTPSNLAISVLGLKQIEVIAGVNVPMILKLISIREKDDLQTSVHKIVYEGQKHIRVASEFLKTSEVANNLDNDPAP